MLAPAGLLVTERVAISCTRWTITPDLLPETTFTVRVSVAYPALLRTRVCCPGSRLDTANGVTHVGSVAPSRRTCAPCGVESTVICPGTTTGAGAAFLYAFRPLADRGVSGSGSEVSAGGATAAGRVTGVLRGAGSGCSAAGWASVAAAVERAELESSSPLRLWMCTQSPIVTTRISTTAPAIE